MDIGQVAVTFAAGAAGCLSMAKLLHMMQRKPEARSAAKPEHELFPNGERDAIIKQMDYLRAENLDRARENSDLRVMVQRESSETRGMMQRVLDRLDRAGIA